jgi:two-component system, NarL family, response regulator NreC
VSPEEARVGGSVRVRSSSRELEGWVGTIIDRLGHDERPSLNVLLDGGRSELIWHYQLEQLEEDESPRGSSLKRAPNARRPSRVLLLVDDHTMFRRGLTRMLTTYGGMEVGGEVSNDESALRLSLDTRPDVVVEVQTPLRESQRVVAPDTLGLASAQGDHMIIVTKLEAPRYLGELMGLGVSACLLKSASVEHLIATIRAVVFDSKGEKVVVDMPCQVLEEARGAEDLLSTRELEILVLAARGLRAFYGFSLLYIILAATLVWLLKRIATGAPPELGDWETVSEEELADAS